MEENLKRAEEAERRTEDVNSRETDYMQVENGAAVGATQQEASELGLFLSEQKRGKEEDMRLSFELSRKVILNLNKKNRCQ